MGRVTARRRVSRRSGDVVTQRAETLVVEEPLEHNMWISGAAWCDFISYDPRLPEHLQLYVFRVHRDEAAIQQHAENVFKFLQELDALHEQLTRNAA